MIRALGLILASKIFLEELSGKSIENGDWYSVLNNILNVFQMTWMVPIIFLCTRNRKSKVSVQQ